ncbi:hypothetical protein GGR54DRAFT_373308 [Hypoxylon sp. NC1633]|nr:hypothetical protein GGR54DRAFT_373308 [Hypoxylon sp. NC1633]
MGSIPAGVDLCTIPIGVSPDGIYNFINPTTLAPVNISVSIVLIALSVSLTVGRIYMNRRRLHLADHCTLVACVVNVAFTGVIIAQFRFNRHQWNIPFCWLTAWYFKLLYVQTTLFAPVFFFSKAGIFLLYRQIFGVKKRIRIAVSSGLLLTLLVYLPNIPLAAIFDAPSAGSSWESMATSTKSSHMIIWGIIQSSLTVLLDIYIFILPIPLIIKLQMPIGRRWQVFGVFTTALMGIAASVLSLAYRIRLLQDGGDAIWWQTIVALCALIETNIAIIVSCMPSLAQLLRIHVGESSLIRSLRSRLFGSRGTVGDVSGPSEDQNKNEILGTASFGSGQPRRRDYYQLTDVSLFSTQITSSGNREEDPVSPPKAIVRSVEISQQHTRNSSKPSS